MPPHEPLKLVARAALRSASVAAPTCAPVVVHGFQPFPLVLCQARLFSGSPPCTKKAMPPRPKPPPENEIAEKFLKGSGPGGQKINKTSSAVQLQHIPTGLVVKSQATRSRDQNRKHARELLATKLDDLLNGDQSRTAIVAEVKRKKKASAAKKSNRKYRKLEEEKKSAEETQTAAGFDADAAAADRGPVATEAGEFEPVEEPRYTSSTGGGT